MENYQYHEQYNHTGHSTQSILIGTFKKFFIGLMIVTAVACGVYFTLLDEFKTFLDHPTAENAYSGTNKIVLAAMGMSLVSFIAYTWISFRIEKFRFATIWVWYIVYAISTGLMMGVISMIYTGYGEGKSFLYAIGGATALFGCTWVFGATTKVNLQKLWPYVFFGMIIASIITLILILTHSYTQKIDLIISPIMIMLVSIWISIKIQRLKILEQISSGETLQKVSLIFAWSLLGDYISLVIRLARIFASLHKK